MLPGKSGCFLPGHCKAVMTYQEDNRRTRKAYLIVVFGGDKMVMRIKDCSKEHNPFIKYEYNKTGDDLENLGIRIVKSFAGDIQYSFIYGVNFMTITV